MKKLLMITAMAFVPFTAIAEPETLEEALAVIAELEAERNTAQADAQEASNRANVNAQNATAWYNEAMRLEDLVDDLVTERNALSIERNNALANLEAYQAYVAERYEEILQQMESLNTQIANLEAEIEELLFEPLEWNVGGPTPGHFVITPGNVPEAIAEIGQALIGLWGGYLAEIANQNNIIAALEAQYEASEEAWQEEFLVGHAEGYEQGYEAGYEDNSEETRNQEIANLRERITGLQDALRTISQLAYDQL